MSTPKASKQAIALIEFGRRKSDQTSNIPSTILGSFESVLNLSSGVRARFSSEQERKKAAVYIAKLCKFSVERESHQVGNSRCHKHPCFSNDSNSIE